MKQIITDLIDDMKCISLTEKGWNYITTPIVILMGLYWITMCDHGIFFQLTGCLGYLGSAILWARKSSWGKAFADFLMKIDE